MSVARQIGGVGMTRHGFLAARQLGYRVETPARDRPFRDSGQSEIVDVSPMDERPGQIEPLADGIAQRAERRRNGRQQGRDDQDPQNNAGGDEAARPASPGMRQRGREGSGDQGRQGGGAARQDRGRQTGHNSGIAQLAGFLENPNAFALTLLLSSALAFAHAAPLAARFGLWLPAALIGCMTTGLWFTTSRAAWIAWIAMAVAAAALRALPWRATAIALLATGAICYALAGAAGGATGTAEDKVLAMFGASPHATPLAAAADEERLRTLERTLELWRESPVFGAGLGRYLAIQQAAGEVRPIVIHNTGLWLLVETGLVGTTVFIGGFAAILFILWRKRTGADTPGGGFRRSILLFLVGFAVMSLGHDLLYQRILRFVLGLALVLPRTERLPETEAT